jgi:hypothetical protein
VRQLLKCGHLYHRTCIDEVEHPPPWTRVLPVPFYCTDARHSGSRPDATPVLSVGARA